MAPQPLRADDQENRGNHIRQKERNKICLRLAPSHETQTSEGATTEDQKVAVELRQ